jgi:hypothetical protein
MIIDSGVVTGSLISQGSLVVTGSVTSTLGFTGSFSGSATSAESASYALTASYVANASSFPFTGSAIITGSAVVTGSLTVTGALTAQTIVVQTISSSTEYASGSNIFGQNTGNTHQFTGSVTVSGSTIFNGNVTNSGSIILGSAFQVFANSISNISTGNNSNILLGTTGTTIKRTVADTSPALIVQQAQSSSTGDILQLKNSGSTVFTVSISGSVTAPSFTGSLSGSATNAISASYALTASYISGSGAGVGFPFSGSAVITGSLFVSSSFISGSFTGSLLGTASYASFSNTASYAVSSSYATYAVSASSAPGFTTTKYQATPAVTWSFVHNLNTRNPLIQVYDTNYNQVIPNAIIGTDSITSTIYFDYSASGYAVASNGGGLLVTGSMSQLNQTSAAVTWSFAHNLNTKYPTFEVYDDNDLVVIPAGIRAINNNSAELYFAFAATGKAIANFSGINGAPNATTASFAATASSLNPITNSYVILSQVSSSLNFVDDTAAASGGVPLGGLYRNGNFILIRLS